MEERAWFRSNATGDWHVVAFRDDEDLKALCGVVLAWVRAHQKRAAGALEPACPMCVTRLEAVARASLTRARPPSNPPVQGERLRAIAAAIPPDRGEYRVLALSHDLDADLGEGTRWLIERTVRNRVETVFSSEDAEAVAAFLASRVVSA